MDGVREPTSPLTRQATGKRAVSLARTRSDFILFYFLIARGGEPSCSLLASQRVGGRSRVVSRRWKVARRARCRPVLSRTMCARAPRVDHDDDVRRPLVRHSLVSASSTRTSSFHPDIERGRR